MGVHCGLATRTFCFPGKILTTDETKMKVVYQEDFFSGICLYVIKLLWFKKALKTNDGEIRQLKSGAWAIQI